MFKLRLTRNIPILIYNILFIEIKMWIKIYFVSITNFLSGLFEAKFVRIQTSNKVLIRNLKIWFNLKGLPSTQYQSPTLFYVTVF